MASESWKNCMKTFSVKVTFLEGNNTEGGFEFLDHSLCVKSILYFVNKKRPSLKSTLSPVY